MLFFRKFILEPIFINMLNNFGFLITVKTPIMKRNNTITIILDSGISTKTEIIPTIKIIAERSNNLSKTIIGSVWEYEPEKIFLT